MIWARTDNRGQVTKIIKTNSPGVLALSIKDKGEDGCVALLYPEDLLALFHAIGTELVSRGCNLPGEPVT